jgi:DNA-binding SARP family transcriptional activator/tetratricopeptide (TPR) repeat protein
VLGPIEAVVDGQPVDLGPPKRRLLLALLLLERGQSLSADRLVDLVWETPPPAARRVVFAHIARLRKALAGAARHDVALLRSQAGYRMRVEPHQVDAHLFRQLVTSAAGIADPASRADRLRSALTLWRGPALEDLAAGPGPQRLLQGLEELRLSATEDRIEADLDAGRHAILVTELAELAARHPLRERIAGQLMLARYRCGDIERALHAFRRIRTDLATELGLDPGPALTGRHEAILRRDGSLAAPPVVAAAGGPGPAAPATAGTDPATTVAVPGNPAPAQLPPSVAGFTGRGAELAILDRLLAESRRIRQAALLSVVGGTAGVGKTALAVHWAHRVAAAFPDGQLYVNLRGFDPSGSPMAPADAVRRFLDAFGVPVQRIPAAVDAQTALYRSIVAGKRVLVVLDNAALVEQVRPLLPGAPGCLVVVTSRNQLTGLVAVEGAHPITLDVLTRADARDLLTGRLGPERVAAEPDAVDDIVACCAGLPLALGIVAGRAAINPRLPLRALADELRRDRAALDGLDGGDATSDLRSVFSWSYQRLTTRAARLFRLLAVHPGPDIGVAAAASLLGLPTAEVRPLLSELVRAHLIVEHSPGRYAVHDLLRAYASELVRAKDSDADRLTAVHRLLDHYLHTAAQMLNPRREGLKMVPVVSGVTVEPLPERDAQLAWFAVERPVLLATLDLAYASGFDTHVWQLARTLSEPLDWQGHWQAQALAQQTALAAAQRSGSLLGQAHALRSAAQAHRRLGQLQEAHSGLKQALALYETLGDDVGQAHTHHRYANLYEQQGRYRDALRHAEQALDLYRRARHAVGVPNALNGVGWYHSLLGDHRKALVHCEQALAALRQLGDPGGEADTWDSLGYAHQHLGDHEQAIACYRRALELYRQLGSRYAQADTLVHLGDAYRAAGDPTAARRAWLSAVEVLDQLAHPDAEGVRARLSTLAAPPP